MADTNTFIARGVAHVLGCGLPMAQQVPALCSIMNTDTLDGGSVLRVRRFHVRPSTYGDIWEAGGALGRGGFTAQRVTAVQGGTDLKPYVEKAVSASANLPSQIIICSDGYITRDTEIFIRRPPVCQTRMATLPTVALTFRDMRGDYDGGQLFNYGNGGAVSGAQGITIAEGEGLALRPVDDATGGVATNETANIAMQFTCKFLVGTNTYFLTGVLYTNNEINTAPFCIFNGSGSGVTIQILDVGTQTLGVGFSTNAGDLGTRSLTINGIADCPEAFIYMTTGARGGVAVTPAGFLSDSVPSTIEVKQNSFYSPLAIAEINEGSGSTMMDYINSVVSTVTKTRALANGLIRCTLPHVGWTSVGVAPMRINQNYGMAWQTFTDPALNDLVLQPNEGLAIVFTGFNMFQLFEWEIEFGYYLAAEAPPPSAGASSKAYIG